MPFPLFKECWVSICWLDWTKEEADAPLEVKAEVPPEVKAEVPPDVKAVALPVVVWWVC